MPLTKRSVSPVNVSLNRLPTNVRNNELECVANGTLANLVRQLSSLSQHAEDIFGELYHEAVKLEHKTNTLLSRVDRLAMKVTQLDSNVEEVSLQDLHLRKPFKSSTLIDQQSLSRQTLPTAMSECYALCDKPPELDKLNVYREDGKSGLKFYTDPEYFFRLWKEEMLKDSEQARRIRHAPKTKATTEGGPTKKKEKRVRTPVDPRQKLIENAVKAGNLPPEYQTPEALRQQAMARYPQNNMMPQPPGMIRPETLEGLQHNGHYGSSGYNTGAESAESHYGYVQQQNQQQQHPRVSVMGGVPQYMQQNNRPVTSQYMAPGQFLNQHPQQVYIPPDPDTPTGMPASPLSTDSSRSRGTPTGFRPSQPPPAPPPQWNYQQNGDVVQRMNRMTMDDGNITPTANGPSRILSNQEPSGSVITNQSSGLVDESGGGRAPSPDLPPPPPPLSPEQLAHMSISTISTATDKLPSPPPVTMSTQGPPPGRIPPPPPPPPPGHMLNGAANKSAGNPTGGDGTKSGSPSRGGQPIDPRSDLLFAIRKGIKLKKVDRQEEKEREREAAQEGHDVAAILRKRMEDVMGTSDSEESRSDLDEDDEWDE